MLDAISIIIPQNKKTITEKHPLTNPLTNVLANIIINIGIAIKIASIFIDKYLCI